MRPRDWRRWALGASFGRTRVHGRVTRDSPCRRRQYMRLQAAAGAPLAATRRRGGCPWWRVAASAARVRARARASQRRTRLVRGYGACHARHLREGRADDKSDAGHGRWGEGQGRRTVTAQAPTVNWGGYAGHALACIVNGSPQATAASRGLQSSRANNPWHALRASRRCRQDHTSSARHHPSNDNQRRHL